MNITLATYIYIFFSSLNYVSAVVVTGTQGGVDKKSGFRPFRLEISTFEHAGPAFDLYILALQQMMDVDEFQQLSYYQISRSP